MIIKQNFNAGQIEQVMVNKVIKIIVNKGEGKCIHINGV